MDSQPLNEPKKSPERAPFKEPFIDTVVEIKHTLRVPDLRAKEGLGQEIKSVLQDTYGHDMDVHLLFPFSKIVLGKLEEKKGSPLSLQEKMKGLWELVQSYDYRQGLTIEDAVQRRELDCVLRSLILGAMYEEHLGDEVIVLGDNVGSHTQLIIVEKKSLGQESIDAYVVDPTLTREMFGTPLGEDIGETAMRSITDRVVLHSLKEELIAHPDSPHVVLHFAEGIDAKRVHSVSKYTDSVQSSLWSNFGVSFAKSPSEKIDCFQKAVALDPDLSTAWVNLGSEMPTKEEKLVCFLRALAIDANSYGALTGLGLYADTSSDQIKYLSEALEKRPGSGIALYYLGRVYLQLYEESDGNNQKALANARDLLKRARIALPEHPMPLYYLGKSYTDFPNNSDNMDSFHLIKIWERYTELISAGSTGSEEKERFSFAQKELRRLRKLSDEEDRIYRQSVRKRSR